MSLKPVIKSAREALDRKDYEYCLQLCNDALAFEPDNYILLVFKAVSLIQGPGDVPRGLEAYQLAAKHQPDKELAFQGILNVYESKGLQADRDFFNALDGLMNVYQKQSEPGKHFELVQKKLTLLMGAKDMDGCVDVFEFLASKEAMDLYGADFLLAKGFGEGQCLKQQISLLESYETTCIEKELDSAKTRLGADSPAVIRERLEVEHFKSSKLNALYRRVLNFAAETEAAEKLTYRLFRLLLAKCTGIAPVKGELLKLIHAHDTVIGREISWNLEDSIAQDGRASEANPSVWRWPRQGYAQLVSLATKRSFEEVIQLAPKLSELLELWESLFSVRYVVVRKSIQQLKLKSMAALGYSDDALDCYDEGLVSEEELVGGDSSGDELFYLMLSVFEAGCRYSQAISLIEKKLVDFAPEEPSLILRLIEDLLHSKRFDEAKGYADAVLESYADADNCHLSRAQFLRGLIQWLEGRGTGREGVLDSFLQAAKLDPEQADPFLFLAKVYGRAEPLDLERSKKCAAKALQLSSFKSNEAALVLSELLLRGLGSDVDVAVFEQVKKLLLPLTSNPRLLRCRRLHYFLGVAEFHCSDAISASSHFQAALKGSAHFVLWLEDGSDLVVSDEMCLYWLAQAYWRGGRLASAEKAFSKLLADYPASKLARHGLGGVQAAADNWPGAVSTSLASGDMEGGEHLLLFARDSFRLGRFSAGSRALERSVAELSAGLQKENAYTWRLLSEAFALAAEFSGCKGLREDCWLEHAKQLRTDLRLNAGFSEAEGKLNDMRVPSAEISTRLLCDSVLFALMGLSTCSADNRGRYWLEAGIAFARLSRVDGMWDEYAISAGKSALRELKNRGLASKAHQLLAACSASNPHHCQHHLVRSLQLDGTNVSGWLDLARLYEREGDLELAIETWKRALQVEPDCQVAMWRLAQATASADREMLAKQLFVARPVRFVDEIAEALAAADESSTEQDFARLYLDVRRGRIPIGQVDSVASLSPENAADWRELIVAKGVDCDYLLGIDLRDDSCWGNGDGGEAELERVIQRRHTVEQLIN